MTKKGVGVVVSGKQRPRLDAEAMTQIVIALGRELAERGRTTQRRIRAVSAEAKQP